MINKLSSAYLCLIILKMDPLTIGKALRKRRKDHKINQQDVAEIAGIAVRTLRDIENGSANPELNTMLLVCRVLGMQLTVEPVRP